MSQYIVIDPVDIADMETPVFGGRYAEMADYVELLQKMQPLFNEFETTGTVQAPVYEHMDDIIFKRLDQIYYDNFIRTFINPANRVTVRADSVGRYYAVTDGMHRLYAAKKNGLKILVCIVD